MVLKEEGQLINKSNKKPYLDKKKAIYRLKIAKEQDKNIKKYNFNKIIFSNKLVIKRGYSSRGEYVRRRGKSKVGRKIIASGYTSKFKNLKKILVILDLILY